MIAITPTPLIKVISMKKQVSLFLIITLLSSFTFCVNAFAKSKKYCTQAIKTPLAAVSLYNPDMIGWLENENRIAELCPTKSSTCYREKRFPKGEYVPIYDGPDGQPIGQLEMTYTPGRGISASFLAGQNAQAFKPTFFDPDWGYGPWFHGTLLDETGVWKKIAIPQFQGGWINISYAKVVDIKAEYTENVYRYQDKNIKILRLEPTQLVYRIAQDADMWCEAGRPPAIKPYKEEFLPVTMLYDENCNLRLQPAHPRGC